VSPTEQLLIVLHVLGATVWTGGHLVLTLTVLPRALKQRDPKIIADFEHGFEKLGIPALVIQIVTGLWLAYIRLAPEGDWFAFDRFPNNHILIKLVLLGLTLALAVHARTRVLPGLDAQRLNALAWHIVPVTILAVLLAVFGAGIRMGGYF
jgi:putative copper export protein